MNSRHLDAESRVRLIKLLGLLGSAHSGEVAAAGRKADAFLKQLGLSWRDVICLPASEQTQQKHHQRPDDDPRWLVMVHECLKAGIARNSTEHEFLRSMLGWYGQPTEKQMAWITRLYGRVSS